jgi:hypothetical protein
MPCRAMQEALEAGLEQPSLKVIKQNMKGENHAFD